jgi:hypothetical protein
MTMTHDRPEQLVATMQIGQAVSFPVFSQACRTHIVGWRPGTRSRNAFGCRREFSKAPFKSHSGQFPQTVVISGPDAANCSENQRCWHWPVGQDAHQIASSAVRPTDDGRQYGHGVVRQTSSQPATKDFIRQRLRNERQRMISAAMDVQCRHLSHNRRVSASQHQAASAVHLPKSVRLIDSTF